MTLLISALDKVVSAFNQALFAWIVTPLVVICMVAMTTVSGSQVVARYVFNNSFVWAEEVARYLMIWGTMLAAGLALRSHSHLGIDFLSEKFPAWMRVLVQKLALLIVTGVALVMFWEGWQLTVRNFARNQLSPAMQIPIAWTYAAIPVGGILIALVALEQLLQTKQNQRHDGQPINAALAGRE